MNIVLRTFDPNRTYSAGSDAAGQFKIENVEPGRYFMSATRAGFVNQQYGAKGPAKPGTPLTLTAGQSLTDAVFKLTPHGVVTGKVVDEDGDPVAQALLQCQRYAYNRGRKQLVPGASATTNDLGEYRIFGLAPGRYYVTASHLDPGGGGSFTANPKKDYEEGYAPVYYPNARTAEAAAPLDVTPGAQLRGIDLTLTKTRTVRLRGNVVVVGTNRQVRTNVSLVGRESTGLAMSRAFGSGVDGKGNFEIHNVLPGSYFLIAQTFENNKQSMARVPIEVGSSNIDGLQIALNPGADIAGHLVIENGAATNSIALNIVLQPKIPGPFGGGANGQVNKDGTFVLQNVTADVYILGVYGLIDNFYLKAVRFGDTDVTETGVDFTQGVAPGEFTVLASPAGGQIEGTVQDDKSQPAVGVTVVLVPDGEKRSVPRLYKTANTGPNGSFSLKGIAPGEYKLFAWDQIESGAYQDPDFLKPYDSKGESVSIKENGQDTKQLKLIRVDDTK